MEIILTDEALTEGERAVGICREMKFSDRETALNIYIAMYRMQQKMMEVPDESVLRH